MTAGRAPGATAVNPARPAGQLSWALATLAAISLCAVLGGAVALGLDRPDRYYGLGAITSGLGTVVFLFGLRWWRPHDDYLVRRGLEEVGAPLLACATTCLVAVYSPAGVLGDAKDIIVGLLGTVAGVGALKILFHGWIGPPDELQSGAVQTAGGDGDGALRSVGAKVENDRFCAPGGDGSGTCGVDRWMACFWWG